MQLTEVMRLVAHEGMARFMRKRAGIALPLSVGAMIPGIAERAVERARHTERALDQAADSKIASWMGRPLGGSGGTPGGGMLDFRRFNPSGAFPQPKPGGFGDALRGIAGSDPARALGGQSAIGLADSVKGLAASPLQGVASGISGGIGESIKRLMLGREFGERKDPLHIGGSAAISAFGKELGTSGADLLRDIANKAMESVEHAGDAAAREAILGDLKRTDSVLANADDKVLMEAYHTMTRFAPVLSTDKNAVRSFLRQAVMSGSGPDYMTIKMIADSERAVTGGGKDK